MRVQEAALGKKKGDESSVEVKAKEEGFAPPSAGIVTDQQPVRELRLLGGRRSRLFGGTNLDGENLITVQMCSICAVVRRTLKRGR